MHFAIDGLALEILLGGLFLTCLLKIFFFPTLPPPSFAFSQVKPLSLSTWRTTLASWPSRLHVLAFGFLALAFIDPHLRFPRPPPPSASQPTIPTEGIAVYLALDQSGSMSEAVSAINEKGRPVKIPKIDLLKQVTQQFILDHPSDLLGLVSFARVPKVLVPLTLDQATLIKHLKEIEVVKTPEEEGTAMGYAIFKTAQLIVATRHFAEDLRSQGQPAYDIKSTVIVVVTDGFQDPSHLDQGNRLRTIELDDAAAYAKSQHIRLYVINVDPAMATATYAPQRRQLNAITSATGGKFYMVSGDQGLQDVYTTINQLEKGTIPQEAVPEKDPKAAYSRYSFYPFFLVCGLSLLLLALLLDSFVIKESP